MIGAVSISSTDQPFSVNDNAVFEGDVDLASILKLEEGLSVANTVTLDAQNIDLEDENADHTNLKVRGECKLLSTLNVENFARFADSVSLKDELIIDQRPLTGRPSYLSVYSFTNLGSSLSIFGGAERDDELCPANIEQGACDADSACKWNADTGECVSGGGRPLHDRVFLSGKEGTGLSVMDCAHFGSSLSIAELKKNLASKIFGYLTRCEGNKLYIDPKN